MKVMKAYPFVTLSQLKEGQPDFVVDAIGRVKVKLVEQRTTIPAIDFIRCIDRILESRRTLIEEGHLTETDSNTTTEHYLIVREMLMNVYAMYGEDLHILLVERLP